MSKALRWLLIAMLAVGGAFASISGVASADVDNADATNVQEGDNDDDTDQSGDAGSGDAVAGQVVGGVSSGDTSIDATNRSEDVDVDTGDAEGANSAASFTGLTAGSETVLAADVVNLSAANVQEGDNDTEVTQAAEAASGDGVGGQVIGVVTAAGGSADIVAANTSEDVDVDTGDAEAFNDAASFVGLAVGCSTSFAADIVNTPCGGAIPFNDILNASATNVQEGDNDFSADQSADSASGDGVGGQVLGAVSAGDTSIDATNRSEDVDLDTGDAFSENDVAAFVGLTAGSQTNVSTELQVADIFNLAAANVQEGDNDKEVVQAADAASGDAVGGQVAGVVTSAGGSADLVLANTSEDVDGDTGDTEFFNFDASFTGLNATGNIDIF
jgi:hypothetical protein